METVIPEGYVNYMMRIVMMMPVMGKISAMGSGMAKVRLNATETKKIYGNVTSMTHALENIKYPSPLILSTLLIEVSIE